MKIRFNTIDTVAIAIELQRIKDSRVNQIYDIDNKTYLIKLNTADSNKTTLLFESGIRIHTTKCDWPKNSTPSGFTMKLRKHIRNKRIVSIKQLGCDRIIDIQFGSGEVAYHLVLEFFNRGNIVLTDHEYTIVSLLRVYSDVENHHYANREKYPIERARTRQNLSLTDILEILKSSKKNEPIRKSLLPKIDFGLSFLEHCLIKAGLNPDIKLNSPSEIEGVHDKLVLLVKELSTADDLLRELHDGSKGYISCLVKKKEDGSDFLTMMEFNPYAFIQNKDYETKVYDSFTDAVDEYFSKLESQKLELSVIEKETEAMRKVNKIKADQEARLQELSEKQQEDKVKADLIMSNAATIEDAIKIVRYSIAAQMSWGAIKETIEEAKRRNDPIASLISKTKFQINQISMMLSDPFADSDDENTPTEVDIDLSLSAHANATRYYDHKKHAAVKEKKTLESQKKAIKSAEKKAREILKTVKTKVSITVSRKVFWFEKFFWFISSDDYLVIGGRDQKQNELIVKRYMKPCDLYVHADLVGASSIVIKNPSGAPVPPRTLDEAGHMAVCYSNAWETKIICRAWWVYGSQVSKTAPAGEYLVTGSFMVRGQKNYLLPKHLQLGYSFMFKIDEGSAFRHVDERKPKLLEESCENPFSSQPENKIDKLAEEFEEELQIDDENPDDQIDNETNEENTDSTTTQENDDKESGSTTSYLIRDDARSSSFNMKYSNKLFLEEQEETKENVHTDNALVISLKDGNIPKPTYSEESPTFLDNIDTKNALVISVHSSRQESNTVVESCDDEKNQNSKTIYLDPSRKIPKQTTGKKIDESARVADKSENDDTKGDSIKQQAKIKRGQKSKLKKIKEKYKDQDEEEKQLRMAILQSAGSAKKVEKKGTKGGQGTNKQNKKGEGLPVKKTNFQSMEAPTILETEEDKETEKDMLMEKEKEISTELDMLSVLTGQPHLEDELLYALPVVAPYNAVIKNKFKMKIVPGTTKRGKAARTALEYFLRSKECSSNEKELLKCVDDQTMSRNFPGKVKLLAIQLKKK